ncbi:MAG: phosphate signaling complex protein PhoU [Bacteroidota bacterium]|nr:phosphate signaling complex protein PhoU [Bacteroidota bacterium]
MNPLDREVQMLKNEILEMFELVQIQLGKSIHAILNHDLEAAKEVLFYEKRVNIQELKIDRDCERFVALYNPVAMDLRFAFATFKINSHLERLGDNAKGIARFVRDQKIPYDKNLLEKLRVQEMFNIGYEMTKLNAEAYLNEDSSFAKRVFELDFKVDKINSEATGIIAQYMKENPNHIESCLALISTIRKLERVGDLNLNIAEEIVFSVEAKILKHSKELKVKG